MRIVALTLFDFTKTAEAVATMFKGNLLQVLELLAAYHHYRALSLSRDHQHQICWSKPATFASPVACLVDSVQMRGTWPSDLTDSRSLRGAYLAPDMASVVHDPKYGMQRIARYGYCSVWRTLNIIAERSMRYDNDRVKYFADTL